MFGAKTDLAGAAILDAKYKMERKFVKGTFSPHFQNFRSRKKPTKAILRTLTRLR